MAAEDGPTLCALNEKLQQVIDDECGLIEPTVTGYTTADAEPSGDPMQDYLYAWQNRARRLIAQWESSGG